MLMYYLIIRGKASTHKASYPSEAADEDQVLQMGTWADTGWAIDFYEKKGFRFMSNKDELLTRYRNIPQRQVQTSVVPGMEL